MEKPVEALEPEVNLGESALFAQVNHFDAPAPRDLLLVYEKTNLMARVRYSNAGVCLGIIHTSGQATHIQ